MSLLAGQIAEEDDFTLLESGSISKPVVRLVQSTLQNIPHNTETALVFGTGSEIIDTDDYHSESLTTSRITPQKPGTYRATSKWMMTSRTDYTMMDLGIALNGAIFDRHRGGPGTQGGARSIVHTALVDVNGSTDYVEIRVLHTNTAAVAATVAVAGGTFGCTFELEFIRD